MKLFWCYLFPALVAVFGVPLDVEKTMKQPSVSKKSIEDKIEKITRPDSTIGKKINSQEPNVPTVGGTTDIRVASSAPKIIDMSTRRGEPKLMVVLPYTPRDRSSLQELLSRPRRTPIIELQSDQKIVKRYALLEKLIDNLSDKLLAFLDEINQVNLSYDKPTMETKSFSKPNYDPIDYDSVRVIPFNKGINPINEQVYTNNDQSKRKYEALTTSAPKTTTIKTTTEEPKTNAASDTSVSADDTGASIADLEDSFGGPAPAVPDDSALPPPRRNGFYWMLDWNSFLEVGEGDTKVNIRFEPKLGDPQMFLPVTVP